MPSYLAVVFVFDYLAGSGWKTWAARDYLVCLSGWRGDDNFVGQIPALYIPFYRLMRGGGAPDSAPGLLLRSAYPFIAGFGRTDFLFHAYHWLFYFQLMLFGGWLAHDARTPEPGRWATFGAFAALWLIYVGLRIEIARGGRGRLGGRAIAAAQIPRSSS